MKAFSPSDLYVRAMEPQEFGKVRALTADAFGAGHVPRLLDALRGSWAWHDQLSFVAVVDDEIVGHVLYSGAILDAPSQLVDVLVLSPLSVRPDLQGKGIGGTLISRTLRALRSRPEPAVFLEGSPDYYGRFGFRAGRHFGFDRPSTRIPDDAFQALRLTGYEPWMTGRLVYPDAFWRTDAVGLR